MSSNKIAGPMAQGDILFVPRSEQKVPERYRKRERPRQDGRLIIAYGEQTGHHHSIPQPGAVLFEYPGGNSENLIGILAVQEECSVTHQEHDALTLSPGIYDVRSQREELEGRERRVVD